MIVSCVVDSEQNEERRIKRQINEEAMGVTQRYSHRIHAHNDANYGTVKRHWNDIQGTRQVRPITDIFSFIVRFEAHM